MSEIPEIGKISADVFKEIIFPHLGAKSKELLVGPRHGVDVGIAEIGYKAVSFTTDPVFIVPEYGWERAAWFALHILASDSVTSGLRPKYLSIDLNLPMDITKEQMSIMWDTIHKECEKLGVNIITGHTARYDNCHYPMVGGATMIGIGEKDEYVTPALCKAGDKIIVTKGPAIEAAGIFATMFPKLWEKEYGKDFADSAQDIFYQMSVVKEALIAVNVGVRENGVTAMHDATECGVWGGIHELADAAGLGCVIEKEKIVTDERIIKICSYFGIDPYASISEGTLIIICREHKAQAIIDALSTEDIKASVVGEMTEREKGKKLIENGQEGELIHPIVDPFWKAFYGALEKHSELEG